MPGLNGRRTVRFSSSDAPRLVPPDRSVTDGGDGSVIPLRCLGTPRIRVQLRFDLVTEEKVAGIAGLYRRARMVAVPVFAVSVMSSVWLWLASDGSADGSPLPVTARAFLVAALSGAVTIGLAASASLVNQRRRVIPQYPVGGGGYIVMRNLHPDTARRWVAANDGLIQ